MRTIQKGVFLNKKFNPEVMDYVGKLSKKDYKYREERAISRKGESKPQFSFRFSEEVFKNFPTEDVAEEYSESLRRMIELDPRENYAEHVLRTGGPEKSYCKDVLNLFILAKTRNQQSDYKKKSMTVDEGVQTTQREYSSRREFEKSIELEEPVVKPKVKPSEKEKKDPFWTILGSFVVLFIAYCFLHYFMVVRPLEMAEKGL